jgi:glycogen phosphorylase
MPSRLTILPQLPPALAPLERLARDVSASWDGQIAALFAEASQDQPGGPLVQLAATPPERLAQLAADESFVARVQAAVERVAARTTGESWYATLGAKAPRRIAYFSPEYGLGNALPQYSGGLGILAGDHLKASSDLGVPVVAVGLFYRQGYFRQVLTASGEQREVFSDLDPAALPVTPALAPDGSLARVAVAFPDDVLQARIWRVDVGGVPLLLLDADVPENIEEYRHVTDQLYGGDREHRLQQELLLGVGGVRALQACGFDVEVFHTNEGHAGFLGVERIRALVEEGGLDPDSAIEAVRAGTVFTTHTPVPAGIDRFPRELVGGYAEATGLTGGLDAERLLGLGAEPDGDPAVFNMAVMGIRLAARVNGVSRLHGDVSRAMFAGLWPGLARDEVPIGHITNGVHAGTWVGPEMDAIYRGRLGDGYGQQGHGFAALADISDEELRRAKDIGRGRLVAAVRARKRRVWAGRGLRGDQLGFAEGMLDPGILTIGFARRVPTYKRLTLMLRDPARLERLLLHPERPVQIVVAGKAHPADEEGKALIAQLGAFAARIEVRHRVALISDYDMAVARGFVGGVDVWLNNPLRPFEACGTSGMKAALNGGLNLSILDGWWDEWYDGENGWAIPSADDGAVDRERRDDYEATALYDLLERVIAPRFYEDRGRWLQMVRHTISTLAPNVLATRMVRDYVDQLYQPAANEARRLAADNFAAARRLAEFRARASAAWPEVAIVHTSAEAEGGHVSVAALVALGSLSTSDVVVEAVVHHDSGTLIYALQAGKPTSAGIPYATSIPAAAGRLEIAVRVLPRHPDLADGRSLGLAVRA